MTGDRSPSRRRFLAGLGSTLAGAVGLAGCGYVPGGGDIRWTANYSDFSTDRVAATGDTIYAMARSERDYDFDTEQWTDGARVRAVSASGGVERWTQQYDSEGTAFGVGAGAAALGAGGSVVRLDADGEAWRATVAAAPAALAVTDDRVYGLTETGVLFGCGDGALRWQREDPGFRPDSGLGAGPDGVVAVRGGVSGGDDTGDGDTGTGDDGHGTLVCLAPDGTERWTRPDLGGADRVVVRSRTAYVLDDEITAVDTASGGTEWASNADGAGGFREPAYRVTERGVFRVDDGALVALDGSGDVRWSFGGDGGRRDEDTWVAHDAAVAVDVRGVFVETEDGLTALAAGDGKRRWTVSYDRLTAGPFLVESGVVVATQGDLVCHVA